MNPCENEKGAIPRAENSTLFVLTDYFFVS